MIIRIQIMNFRMEIEVTEIIIIRVGMEIIIKEVSI
jgi:hypothetical protein